MLLRRQYRWYPDLAETPRERHATRRQPAFKSLGEVSREAGLHMTVLLGQTFVTKPSMSLESWGITMMCTEYISTRDAHGSKPIGTVDQ